MFDIKIYGEIVPFQDNWIIESGYCNLSYVQLQIKEAKGQDLRVRLNSFGGDVEEGFAIYHELRRYAKDNNAKITTLAEGRCASIATVIFLAGDTRIVTETTEPFVHNAWCYTQGDYKEITRTAIDLENATKKIAEHYALHTDLTIDEAKLLMDAETSITPKECLAIRFATEIEEVSRPLALQRFTNNKKMEYNERSFKERILNALGIKESIKNKIELTASGEELDFYELSEDDKPKLGDKATYKDHPADGDYTMSNGVTYSFEKGVLTSIKEKEETEKEKETEEEKEDYKAKYESELIKNKTLEKEKQVLLNKLEKINKTESEIINIIKDNSEKSKRSNKEGGKTDYNRLLELKNKK